MSKGPRRQRRILTNSSRPRGSAEPLRTSEKTAEVQANPAADLEGGGVILRIPPDSCGSLC